MRKKKRLNKKICQTAHFKRRAKQRFGLNLSKSSRKAIIDDIQGENHFCKFIEKQSNTRTKYLVTLDCGVEMVVVSDKLRKSLVTALNPLIER